MKLQHAECKRCGYQWVPRKTDVRQCPKCKSAYWNEKVRAVAMPDDNLRTDEPHRTREVQDAIDTERDLRNETRLRDKDRAGL